MNTAVDNTQGYNVLLTLTETTTGVLGVFLVWVYAVSRTLWKHHGAMKTLVTEDKARSITEDATAALSSKIDESSILARADAVLAREANQALFKKINELHLRLAERGVFTDNPNGR